MEKIQEKHPGKEFTTKNPWKKPEEKNQGIKIQWEKNMKKNPGKNTSKWK